MIWDEPATWGEYREPCRLKTCPVHTNPILIQPPEPLHLEWAKVKRRNGGGPFHAWRNGEGVCHNAKTNTNNRTLTCRSRQPVNACSQCLRVLQALPNLGGGRGGNGPKGVHAPLIVLGIKAERGP